jgi:hypothetical protein
MNRVVDGIGAHRWAHRTLVRIEYALKLYQ